MTDPEWVTIFESTIPVKAQMIKILLIENGIEAILLNQQDSIYPVIGDLKVLVKRDNVILAKKIISQL